MEFGSVWLSRISEPFGPIQTYPEKVRIDRADPCVRIDAELVGDAACGALAPWITYQHEAQTVTICDDFGKRYIYRLNQYDPERHAWEASWPD